MSRDYERRDADTTVNSAEMAQRGSTEVLLFLAATRGRDVREMDISSAFLNSDDISRKVLLTPLTGAGVDKGELCRARKAIYGRFDGHSAFNRALGEFLRKNEIWGLKLLIHLSGLSLIRM